MQKKLWQRTMKTRMIKIEADTLEKAYQDAASSLKCSVTELVVEVVQLPKQGYLGLFKKKAIIVAANENRNLSDEKLEEPKVEVKEEVKEEKAEVKEEKVEPKNTISKALKVDKVKSAINSVLPKKILPTSFSRSKDVEVEDMSYINSVVKEVSQEINNLFKLACFTIDKISVSVYDKETILIEFKGEDSALLIGKEGYRYKAISYMLFNWINAKYKVQLRLEIAEFLQNQEESVTRYIETVCENIDKDGKAQTKILDGVLIQIALKELREKYPQKYVVIRSTKDGMKYIVVNDYHSN